MKKILCTLAVVGLASSMYAQGLVSFQNSSASVIKQKNAGEPDSAAVAVPANGGFVQLIWAPAGTAWSYNAAVDGALSGWLTTSSWKILDGSLKAIGPAAGRFNAGGLTVPTATPGAAIDAVIVGWTGNAVSFDDATTEGALTGISSKFSVTTGNPTTEPPGTPAAITGAGQFTGLIVTVVPEPSSLALAGLGAAALLIFRRRK